MAPAPALWLLSALALGGCAAAMPGYSPPNPKIERMAALAPKGGGFDGGGYKLSEQEAKLDCRHLTGGMTIKILQMREASGRHQASATAKSIHQSAKSLVGGSTYGLDNDADFARDRTRLDALNQQLVAKGCKSFAIDAELQSKETPKATVEAKAKK